MSIEQTATTRRVTRPRLLITQVLAELSRFATAQEITDILRERGTRIGTATAYRNVQMMASQGELDVIHVNGEALYRRVLGPASPPSHRMPRMRADHRNRDSRT